jgi:hypothetical protein
LEVLPGVAALRSKAYEPFEAFPATVPDAWLPPAPAAAAAGAGAGGGGTPDAPVLSVVIPFTDVDGALNRDVVEKVHSVLCSTPYALAAYFVAGDTATPARLHTLFRVGLDTMVLADRGDVGVGRTVGMPLHPSAVGALKAFRVARANAEEVMRTSKMMERWFRSGLLDASDVATMRTVVATVAALLTTDDARVACPDNVDVKPALGGPLGTGSYELLVQRRRLTLNLDLLDLFLSTVAALVGDRGWELDVCGATGEFRLAFTTQ